MHAVGRIAYRGWIDNVQVSWVKAGVDGARQALLAGCNDLGGTLMDENISPCRRREPRPGARRRRLPPRSSSRSAARSSSAPRCTAARSTVGRRLRPPAGAHARARTEPAHRSRSAPSPGRRSTLGEAARLVSRIDVVGIGNALVDVLSHEDDAFLADARPREGRDDAHRHRARRAALRGDGAGDRDLGRLGGEHDGRASRRSVARSAFIGRVHDDQLGAVFGHDIRAAGRRVHDRSPPSTATRPGAA